MSEIGGKYWLNKWTIKQIEDILKADDIILNLYPGMLPAIFFSLSIKWTLD